ncbi:MAG TPA: hypothetical protein GX506_05975 [Firmicutes bacterium]|nr:hypothetical protein [Bacillota bacterium]
MASDIEQSISTIPKVRSCKVVLDANKDIDQVFVWADIDSSESDEKEKLRQIKSLVRSVVGTVALKHNYDLDYRKVKILEYVESGVVQGGEGRGRFQVPVLPGDGMGASGGEVAPASETEEAASSAGAVTAGAGASSEIEEPGEIYPAQACGGTATGESRRERPRVKLIAAYVRYLAVPEVVVELGFLGETFIGRAPVDDNLAQGSFAAFREAFEATGLGKVKSIYIAEMTPSLSQPKIVLSKLQLTLPDNERAVLLGAVEDHGDSVVSVVKASLDALNRKITQPV